ncbi:unnamed protein product [Rhizophagus irregularis]|nr:unnamed protein product [Rhizophagus irregularis]
MTIYNQYFLFTCHHLHPTSIFCTKKFLDTSIFKSYKFDKELSNSIQGINNNNDINNNNNIIHRKSIAIPILISNPSKYYKDVEWKTLIKEKFPITITIILSPKQISSIDNVLSSPNGEVDISLLVPPLIPIYNLIK